MKIIDKYFDSKIRKDEEERLLNIYSKSDEGRLKIMGIKSKEESSKYHKGSTIFNVSFAIYALITGILHLCNVRGPVYEGLVAGLCLLALITSGVHAKEHATESREINSEVNEEKEEIIEKLRRRQV